MFLEQTEEKKVSLCAFSLDLLNMNTKVFQILSMKRKKDLWYVYYIQ